MNLQVIQRIACEPHNSSLVRAEPRNPVQAIRLEKLYKLLLLLRILLTLNFQTGWIHSEEFQALEVITGNYFDLQVFQPSEFNSTFPTRSIVFPHLSIYVPYILTHRFLTFGHPSIREESIPCPKTLVLVPRMVHALLSIILDFILLYFFTIQKRKPRRKVIEDDVGNDLETKNTFGEHSRLVTLASSQVMLVFVTRTHAALLNTIFFALLLCFVSDAMHTMDEYLPILNDFHAIKLTPKTEKVSKEKLHEHDADFEHRKLRRKNVEETTTDEKRRHGYSRRREKPRKTEPHEVKPTKSESEVSLRERELEKVREKVKFLKELKAFRYNPIQNLHWIALIVVAGIFNDPDFFLSYAAVPIFFYLQRGISHSQIGMTQFHLRLFIFLVYFFGLSVPFILWDSFYHGRVSWNDLATLNLNSTTFVITPVNYFVTKSSSIRKLETIPWILTNFVFIFNILGILGILSISKETYSLLFQNWKYKPRLNSQWTFLNCSWFIPLVLLVQYKSPFDLAPLLFPLVILHGHKIPLISRFSWKLGFSWFFINLLGVSFWGYLNQGGVVSSFLEFSDQLVSHRFNETHVDILVGQMVTIPPIFLLVLPSTWKTLLHSRSSVSEIGSPNFRIPKTILKIDLDKKVRVFHTGVSPLPFCHLESELLRILDQKSTKVLKVNLILLPRIVNQEVKASSCFRRSRITLVKTYWNHCHFTWPRFEDRVQTNGTSLMSRTKWKNWVPTGSQGLNLYRFEDLRYQLRNESEFGREFAFRQDSFSTCVVQWILFTFTSFLFLMTFVSYIM